MSAARAKELLEGIPDVENLLRRCTECLTWGASEMNPPWSDADVLHARITARTVLQAREVLTHAAASRTATGEDAG